MYEYFDYTQKAKNGSYRESYELDNLLISEFDQIFQSLKGEPKTVRSNNGDIHVPYIIDFKANKNNLKVFRKKINQSSGLVVLLVDVSGSMDSRIDMVRKLVSNLYSSISDISRVTLKVYLYSSSFYNAHDLTITEINDLSECDKIVVDGISDKNYGTPSHYAIDYVTKQNKDYIGKKVLVTITDGSPAIYENDEIVNNSAKLKLECKKAVLNAEELGFNIFGLGVCIPDYYLDSFKNMFRDNFVNILQYDDLRLQLFDKLNDFVRSIRS
jgi:hypothetical protein